MAADPRLPGLQRVAGLVKDMALADLRRAEAERAALLQQMATLSERPTPPEDLAPAIAEDIALRYDRWAELRRREVEQAWRVKSAECDRLRAKARIALGRNSAVASLADRITQK